MGDVLEMMGEAFNQINMLTMLKDRNDVDKKNDFNDNVGNMQGRS